MQLEPAALDREFEARAAVLGPAPAVDKQKRTVDPFNLDAALNRLDHVSDFNGSARCFFRMDRRTGGRWRISCGGLVFLINAPRDDPDRVVRQRLLQPGQDVCGEPANWLITSSGPDIGVPMPGLTKRMTPDRSKIDAQDAKQLKFWLKSLGVSREDLLEAIDKVGNAAAAVRKERHGKGLAMPDNDKPLKPEDFPVNAEGKKIKKQDGTPIAETPDPAVATEVADRLNEDEARREEDKWSA